MDDLNNFVEELPHQLKIEVSLFLHEKTYKKIPYLIGRADSFKAWICPLLKPLLISERQNVYFEDDEIVSIYFLKQGDCGFVLPKHDNVKYIQIETGQNFGIIDIIGSILQNKDGYKLLKEWIKHKDKMKRQFTVMAFQ
jgi:hypothetical protein